MSRDQYLLNVLINNKQFGEARNLELEHFKYFLLNLASARNSYIFTEELKYIDFHKEKNITLIDYELENKGLYTIVGGIILTGNQSKAKCWKYKFNKEGFERKIVYNTDSNIVNKTLKTIIVEPIDDFSYNTTSIKKLANSYDKVVVTKCKRRGKRFKIKVEIHYKSNQ